jgi:hypothetical protein
MAGVRVVGTAAACVLVAFGAAFLIARAVGHQGSASAATTTQGRPAFGATTDAALAAQFIPKLTALRQPARARRHVVHHRAVHRAASHPASVTTKTSASHPASVITTTSASPPPTTSTTASSPPQVQSTPTNPAPASSDGGSSGTGSGTTSVGGHTHHKGSGTTKVP